ncbi:MAG: hypothetical protein AAF614_22850 [Chloroflexota bacterium]
MSNYIFDLAVAASPNSIRRQCWYHFALNQWREQVASCRLTRASSLGFGLCHFAQLSTGRHLCCGDSQRRCLCCHQSGASWTAWNFGLYDTSVNAIAVSPSFAKDKTIWIGTESNVFKAALAAKS